jgi:hypothetical protein
MATIVWTNAYLTVNAVDLSDHVKQITLNYEAEMQDETAMGQTTRKMKPGLLNWSLEVEFFQDFAASKVDATLFPLVGAVAFAVAVRPVNTTIAATNPEYQGNAVLATYPIIAGSVGDMATVSVSFQPASALVRDITP